MSKITTEQMNDLAPFAQQYQQEKREAAEQHQAEIDAAQDSPNYEATTKTRKPRKSANKTVTFVARYAHKTNNTPNGNVSYLVRNGGGKHYCVTITSNGNTACVIYQPASSLAIPESCESSKGGRKCYHIKACQKQEEARGQVQDSQYERETFGLPLDEVCKSAEIAKRNMQLTPEEGTARDAALAAARAESDALLAQIDAEVQQVIEQEQAAPQQPKSEQARFADLPLSENERKETRLASLNEEFPVGMVVPTFHGAGVLVEGGAIVEPVATNFENIDFVVVERMESSERVGISCSDLRCLIRECASESVDEEEKYQQWTDEELLPGAGWLALHEEGECKQREMSRRKKEQFNAELQHIKAEQAGQVA